MQDLDFRVLCEEKPQPRAGSGRSVLTGQQQTNQHTGNLVVGQVTTAPKTTSNTAVLLQLTGRLHGTIVGPTGRSDWSVRLVG